MVAAHALPAASRRSRLDWRALAVVVLVHVALMSWLVRPRWVPAELAPSAAMVLIHLWEPAQSKPERLAGTAAPVPRTAAAPKKAATSPRPAGHRRPDRSVVVPEGRRAVETGADARETAAVVSVAAAAADGAASSVAAGDAGVAARPRFKAPRVKRRVIPDYPATAFRAGEQGRVDVIVTIAADGGPLDAHVYQSSGSPSLDEASVAAALRYAYQPGQRNGTPVEAQGIVTIDWKIGPKTIEHLAGDPAALDAEQKRLECLGTMPRDLTLSRNAALCGKPQRR
jgi:protein TonB